MKFIDNQSAKNFLEEDDVTFEDLVGEHLKPIYNFLYRMVGDRQAAEDLTQDTFLKAWKNLRRFDRSRNFKTWLFTIAKNTAFDFFRKKREIPFSNFTSEEGGNWLENIADENILPDEFLERSDLAEKFEKILGKIPIHYRAILLLHYKEDFSLYEIAEILGEPYNTIKSRHQRGIVRLKKTILGV
jgi:RNA polymerase sigma-70 factor, ECF subfamily